ncbi:MAG: glycosyltransferase [Candidatus Diapherotrites archaeon]
MKASVIVPVRNGERTIEKCLKAILAQNLGQSFELIVVDDGSTDKTAEIVKKFKKARLFRQEPLGPAAARNAGAIKAKGEIIVFTDADCIPEKNWLSEMLKPFEDPMVAGVQGAYKTQQKEFMARFSQIEIEERYKKMLSSKTIDWIGSYSAAYKRSVFLSLNGFDKAFKKASGEDPDLSYSIQEKDHKIVFNPKAIVFHHHPVSLAEYLKKKFQHACWRVLLYKKHSSKAVSDSYTPQFLKAQIGFLGIFSICLLLSLWNETMLFFALAALVLLIFCMLPFVFFALKRDFFIGIASPAILLLRDIAFIGGLLKGILFLVWNNSASEKVNKIK